MPHDEPVDPLHLSQVILSRPNFGNKKIRRAQLILLFKLELCGQPQTLLCFSDTPLGPLASSPGEPGEGCALAQNVAQPLVVGTHSEPMSIL